MLGIGGAAGLAGCAGGPSTETGTATEESGDELGTATETPEPSDLPEVSGTYNAVTSSPYQTLNPLYNTENGAGTAIGYALDLGYGFKPGTRLFPEPYDLTTDSGQVWTATVRENLEFSDPYGQVTAETFTYQIQEVQQSDWAATADQGAWQGSSSSVENVEQTGEFEFQIELTQADLLYPESYDPLLYPIPMGLMEPYVNEEDAQGMQEDEDLLELTFTGNLGPFTLEEWNRSSGVTYSRNEDYYMQDHAGTGEVPASFENAPYFEGLQVDVVQEQASRLAALETGEADAATVPPNRVSEFQENDDVSINVVPQPYNKVNVYNMRDNGWNAGPGNLFRSRTFRQGLGCAVDKEKLVTGVFRDFAEVEYTWQPRWSKWYPGDEELTTFGTGDLYGREAAQSRVKEAIDSSEYDYSYDGDTLVNPSGEQVELELYHSAGQETEKAYSQFIAQEYADNVGISVNVNAINGAKFANDYWAQEVPDNPDQYEWSKGQYNAGPRSVTSANGWDMATVFGLNTYPLNPLTGDIFFIRDSFYNPYGYYPEWNAKELFEQAANASSEEELTNTLATVFAEISEAQPMAMDAFPSDTVGYNASLQGPAENFFNGWNFPSWSFEE